MYQKLPSSMRLLLSEDFQRIYVERKKNILESGDFWPVLRHRLESEELRNLSVGGH